MYSVINFDDYDNLKKKYFILNKIEIYPTEKSNIHKIRYNLINNEDENIKILSGKNKYFKNSDLQNDDLLITLHLKDKLFLKTLRRLEYIIINKIVPNKNKKNSK